MPPTSFAWYRSVGYTKALFCLIVVSANPNSLSLWVVVRSPTTTTKPLRTSKALPRPLDDYLRFFRKAQCPFFARKLRYYLFVLHCIPRAISPIEEEEARVSAWVLKMLSHTLIVYNSIFYLVINVFYNACWHLGCNEWDWESSWW